MQMKMLANKRMIAAVFQGLGGNTGPKLYDGYFFVTFFPGCLSNQ